MKKMPIIFSYSGVKDLFPNKNSYLTYVKRNLKSGKIKRIKRGLYGLVNSISGFLDAHKFQIACHLLPDAYFTYHDALEFYGAYNQCYVSIFRYCSKKRIRDLECEDVMYECKKSKCDLQILDLMKTRGVRVVSVERAIIDCINSPFLAGGIEEIENALEIYWGFKYITSKNINKVIEILDFYNKPTLYQRTGYLFEKYFQDDLPKEFYDYCLSKMSKRVICLERIKSRWTYNKKWKIKVNKYRDMPDDIF